METKVFEIDHKKYRKYKNKKRISNIMILIIFVVILNVINSYLSLGEGFIISLNFSFGFIAIILIALYTLPVEEEEERTNLVMDDNGIVLSEYIYSVGLSKRSTGGEFKLKTTKFYNIKSIKENKNYYILNCDIEYNINYYKDYFKNDNTIYKYKSGEIKIPKYFKEEEEVKRYLSAGMYNSSDVIKQEYKFEEFTKKGIIRLIIIISLMIINVYCIEIIEQVNNNSLRTNKNSFIFIFPIIILYLYNKELKKLIDTESKDRNLNIFLRVSIIIYCIIAIVKFMIALFG